MLNQELLRQIEEKRTIKEVEHGILLAVLAGVFILIVKWYIEHQKTDVKK